MEAPLMIGERLMLSTTVGDGETRDVIWTVKRVVGSDVVLTNVTLGTTQIPFADIPLKEARDKSMFADLDSLR